MTVSYDLCIEVTSYWRPGTGKGSGSHVDAVVDKDRFGCPFIGGRMLKGLLRDAVYRTAHWNSGGFEAMPDADDIVETLFGSWSFEDMRPRYETQPGLIRVSDAVLEEKVRHWLGQQTRFRQALYRDIYSTAIESSKRTAKQGSLRGQQVIVPMTLYSNLEVSKPSGSSPGNNQVWVFDNAKRLIELALPLVRAIGAGRTRGLGRARLRLEEAS